MLISSHVRNRADSNTVITFLSERTGVYSILQGPSGCAQERFAYLQTSALLCVGCSGKGHHEHMQRLQPPSAKGAREAGAGQLGGSAKSNRSCCDFRGFYPVRVDERPPLGDVRNSRSHILVKSNQFILAQSGSDYKGLSRRQFAQIHTLTTFSGMFRQMMKFKHSSLFLANMAFGSKVSAGFCLHNVYTACPLRNQSDVGGPGNRQGKFSEKASTKQQITLCISL